MTTNEKILVSAIITTYKRPIEILKRAVNSVIAQTYRPMELIVVNDCPDDKASIYIKDLLDEFSESFSIKYILHEKNWGACKARNTGIDASNGEFVAFLDDDDEWMPDKIEKQLQGFVNEKVGLVYSPFYNIMEEGKEELAIRETKSGNLFADLLWTNCVGGTSMPMIRKSVFNDCGSFDEKLMSLQDYDMWIRIAEKYEMVCINEPLTRRFLQEDSITKKFYKQVQGMEYFLNKHAVRYASNPKAFNHIINRRVNKWIEQGHFKEAGKIYFKAVKAKKISKYNITEPIKGIMKYIYGVMLKLR